MREWIYLTRVGLGTSHPCGAGYLSPVEYWVLLTRGHWVHTPRGVRAHAQNHARILEYSALSREESQPECYRILEPEASGQGSRAVFLAGCPAPIPA